MRLVFSVLIALAASWAIADDAMDIKSEALQKRPGSAGQVRGKEDGTLKVDGIVHGPEGAFAIIEGRAYLRGEGGEGFVVRDIEPLRVLIESGGGLEYLPLKPRERPREAQQK